MIESPEQYIQFLDSNDREIQRHAVNEPASAATWRAILARFPQLREEVAFNKHLPLEIIHELATDTSERVRFAIALKNSLPVELLQAFSRDESESVRTRVALHKSVPREVLQRLANDPIECISAAAKTRLQCMK